MAWINVRGRRRIPDVRQATATECGLACVATIAGWHGAAYDLSSLRRRFRTSLRGQSLTGLVAICNQLKLRTRAVRCEIGDLAKVRTPCILHWKFDHFVVLVSVARDAIVVQDPARGRVQVQHADVDRFFTGVALEVSPSSDFERSQSLMQLSLTGLIPRRIDYGRRMVAALMLALICECLVLVAPLFLQTVIDEVVVSGDTILLDSLLFGFLALLAFQIVATVMRSLTFQALGFMTIFDLAARVHDWLLRLPLSWFRSRELGDIQHRFLALSRIQAFIVEAAPRLLIDAMFFVLLVAFLLLYEPIVTLANLAAILLIVIWRAAILPVRLRIAGDIAVAEASVQSHFIESLRGIVSIKSANISSYRASDWCNQFADAVNAKIRAGNLSVVDGAVRQAIQGFARIVTIYVLANAVLDAKFTVGMLATYAAYLGMLSARTSSIIDVMLEYRLLRVPLSRLGDVVFSEPERSASPDIPDNDGRVVLRDVSYSYGETERPVLRECHAVFESGSLTVISGPSGCGKSTLLQLIAGAENPTAGEIHVGGVATRQTSPNSLRQIVGTVFHDDCLLRGSVFDNISMFDSDSIKEHVYGAAAKACIHDEIVALPMGYQTRVSDMGSSLSKGQMQRVLLARAYYCRRRILILDEPTTGLDHHTEKRVIDALRQLPITRIVVTHSDQLLEVADRVLWLDRGTLVSSPPALEQ